MLEEKRRTKWREEGKFSGKVGPTEGGTTNRTV